MTSARFHGFQALRVARFQFAVGLPFRRINYTSRSNPSILESQTHMYLSNVFNYETMVQDCCLACS